MDNILTYLIKIDSNAIATKIAFEKTSNELRGRVRISNSHTLDHFGDNSVILISYNQHSDINEFATDILNRDLDEGIFAGPKRIFRGDIIIAQLKNELEITGFSDERSNEIINWCDINLILYQDLGIVKNQESSELEL